MKIKTLTWDSNFFKKKVGEIFLEDDKTISDSNLYDFLVVKSNFPVSINLKGFESSFHETKLLFSKKLSKKNSIDSGNVISIFDTNFNKEDLYQLAVLSGKYSRFRIDPKFTNDEFRNLYYKIVDNSFKKLIAEDIFAFVEDKSILGFVSFIIEENKGVIGLIAVDENFQGKGIGKKLISNVESYLQDNNINQLDIPTQESNTTACRFYKKMGYTIKNKIEVYHYWSV